MKTAIHESIAIGEHASFDVFSKDERSLSRYPRAQFPGFDPVEASTKTFSDYAKCVPTASEIVRAASSNVSPIGSSPNCGERRST